MPDTRDPTALLRHAVLVGDWRLVELLALRLRAHQRGTARAAHRAYDTLVLQLGLSEPADRPG